ncbi:MAG: hypothetical protein JSW34_04175 [Candidatus Zixiibacteriota bacterium]|nr:MAG: hypothetical protein JSW34_04175 [candidate division Zixibacteria bacterium]
MMWAANTTGDPVDGEFVDDVVWTLEQGWIKSAPDAHGVLFLGYPPTSGPPKLSYNWWSGLGDPIEWDFGPRRRDNYRTFLSGGTGWPYDGDACRYYVMSNGEIDYDLLYSMSIKFDDPVWLPPPADIAEIASTLGLPSAQPNLLSVGSFDIPPGATVNIPWAFVGGRNLHTDPNNSANLPYAVNTFYGNLDFSDLIQNATWAKWIYDNPGLDTDGDGYAGEFAMCDGDTVYTSGDGIPDWQVAVPPPPPEFWLEPVPLGLRVRFNGTKSEAAMDLFSSEVDFEGYRIYFGLDERESSLHLVASYDVEDYDKFVWNGDPDDVRFFIMDIPFTRDSLRCLYGTGADPCGDTAFDPLSYTRSSPYVVEGFPDSVFYFLPHEGNTGEFGVTTPIQKVYPDEPYPASLNVDSVPAEALTAEGNLKYFEYELIIENLLPTVPYWVNVTTFDFGAPSLRLQGLETSTTLGAKSAYPLPSSGLRPGDAGAEVYVYPNPYRIDGDYRDLGLEGRTQEDRPDHRVRAIRFGNVPAKCTISIYSLDGDLVRRLDHDMDPSDPNSSHATWNLITRNTQMVVSGLYYWVVEAEDGSTQMGKLVIIM